jgi:hypothetical protein
MRRFTHLFVVGILAATALVTISRAQVASGQTGPIGYSVGFEQEVAGRFPCGLYSVDLSSGEATRITPDGEEVPCADGLTFSPDGTLYAYRNFQNLGISGAELITIDLATGAQTLVGELPPAFVGAGGMTFDVAGNLWLYAESAGSPECDSFDSCLWQVDPATADSTFVGAGPGPADAVFGLAGNCAGEVVAITTPVSAGPVSETELQLVDTSTAGLTPIVDVPDVFAPSGLDYDGDEGLWALAREPFTGFPTQTVHQIDPTTGDATTTTVTVGGDPFAGLLDGLAVSPISCPEPPPTPEPVVIQPTFTG